MSPRRVRQAADDGDATGGADRRAASGGDSAFDASAFEASLEKRTPARWIGWRLRLLVGLALLGVLGIFAVMRLMAGSAHLDLQWQATSRARLTVLGGGSEALNAAAGRTLDSISVPGQTPLPVEELTAQHSARWLVDDERRARYLDQQQRLSQMLAGGRVTLHFTDGSQLDAPAPPRGYAGLGLLFWPLVAFALVLYLIAGAVLLQRPDARNLLYSTMAWCQAGNLLLIACEPTRGLGQPPGFAPLDLQLRMSFDVITAAAGTHAYALHPRRVPGAGLVAAAAWAAVAVWALYAWGFGGPHLWPWTQFAVIGLGSAATAVIAWSYRVEANPFVAVMRRFTFIAVATLTLVTLAIVGTHRLSGTAPSVAAIGTVVWYLFFASLLLLVPFLSRSKQALREFAMLAGISTVATSLDLLFIALFSLGPFASLTLAMFLALGVYAGARQWIMNQMVGTSVLTTERTFEQLYRVAREVMAHPERRMQRLAELLRDLFEPLEVLSVPRRLPSARVVGSGSALYVPLPAGPEGGAPQTLVMRFAGRGKRIFTQDDARLAERVVDQVSRAVALDQAIEQGRTEERQRIAQDLHDDIGARLLTLMYKATDREMEEYVRHTLQDLKTLTRGLASTDHRLSHAAGEWKADLAQRLGAAKLRFDWSFQADRDIALSVVQWSGLTRILRELVSNTIYHAEASRVTVGLQLEGPNLALTVADDGKGGDPSAWSHGLGLGGVRKRCRALGGSVEWLPNGDRGIRCEVRIGGFVDR